MGRENNKFFRKRNKKFTFLNVSRQYFLFLLVAHELCLVSVNKMAVVLGNKIRLNKNLV